MPGAIVPMSHLGKDRVADIFSVHGMLEPLGLEKQKTQTLLPRL
jgi:hypothetical protein